MRTQISWESAFAALADYKLRLLQPYAWEVCLKFKFSASVARYLCFVAAQDVEISENRRENFCRSCVFWTKDRRAHANLQFKYYHALSLHLIGWTGHSYFGRNISRLFSRAVSLNRKFLIASPEISNSSISEQADIFASYTQIFANFFTEMSFSPGIFR